MTKEQNITHFVFALKTLGILPNSVCLSLGIVPFQFENNTNFKELVNSGFYVKLDVKEQIQKYKRTVSDDTMHWWKKQGEDAKKILKPSSRDVCLEEAMENLWEFLLSNNYDPRNSYLWSRGNLFDFGKMESIFHDLGMKEPYNGWKVRDIRTMIDCLCGVTNGKIKPLGPREGIIPNNALHDAANDAMTMIEVFQSLAESVDA